MRVMITGGGTGGHLYPALAVAEQLREQDPGGRILFVGTEDGMESTVVPARGFAFHPVSAVKWPRQLSAQAFVFLPSLWRGYRQSLAVIRQWHPQAVFATGGYVSVPLAMAAARLRIPLFLHEQNTVPGMANRLLSRWARAVFLTFPVQDGKLVGTTRVVHTGLPIRQEILKVTRPDGLNYLHLAPGLLTVLVTGGSRGARRINQVMLEVYLMLAESEHRPLQFVHLTGRVEYEALCQQMAEQGINEGKVGKIVMKPYLDQMEYGLAVADLVIARAGAATIAELTALGIPALLIPYPYAAGNHQHQNALHLAKEQAAVLIPESELTPERLFEQLQQIIEDDALRQGMGLAARRLGRPRAGEIIAHTILKAGRGFHTR